MKFRPKLAKALIIPSLYLGFFPILQGALMIARNRALAAALIILATTLMVACFWAYRNVYWELNPDCLTVRRLWGKRTFTWNQVTDVGWLGPMSGTFRVNVGHQIEDYDRLYIEPSDRLGLATALKRFAPHTHFELE